ncbi:MAG: ATP-binding protein [Myxococcales bacterium]|nr:ATP-binding protein [Myxococcales bacterium]
MFAEIDQHDIIARLKFDNPWWEDHGVGQVVFQTTPRRKYFESFYSLVADTTVRRAIVLMGPRRVGKTVMLYHSIRALLDTGVEAASILYVSLETPVYTGLSLERILGLFQDLHGHPRHAKLFVFFDEIQYLRNWEVHLKSLVDSYLECRFIATGSAAAALRLKSQESGAGRFSDFVLPPLTFAEYLQFIGCEQELIRTLPHEKHALDVWPYTTTDIHALNAEFINYLNFGGYPEAVFSKTIRENPNQYIKSDVIDKVLLRDLPSLYGISDIQELNRLFTTLAYNTANEVSPDKLCQSSGVAKNTVRRYLEYLEAAFLVSRIERIDQNATRFRRALWFKVYLTNPSMRAALFGPVTAESKEMGPLTETAVLSQWSHTHITKLYYARWNGGEVDLVHLPTHTQTPSWATEIKWSDRPYTVRSELDACVTFAAKHPGIGEEPLVVTSRTVTDNDVQYRNVRFKFIPASLYVYAIGANLYRNTARMGGGVDA